MNNTNVKRKEHEACTLPRAQMGRQGKNVKKSSINVPETGERCIGLGPLRSPGGVCFNVIYDKGDLLPDGTIGRVQQNRVLGTPQGSNITVPILSITPLDLSPNLVEGDLFSVCFVFFKSAPSPLVDVGHHEDLNVRIGKDDGAGVPTIENDSAVHLGLLAPDSTLLLHHIFPHRGQGRDVAYDRAYLCRAKRPGYLLVPQKHVHRIVPICHVDGQGRQDSIGSRDRRLRAGPQETEGNGPVHGAGV